MDSELTGLSGWIADVLAQLGAWGVGLGIFAESIFPPLPSEVILPLAGYLAERGRMDLAWVLAAATLGSVLGALVFYEAARALGGERAARLLARLPLLNREDMDRSMAWFDRHGTSSVLCGRLVPGVRSLISLPAGAARMPRFKFLLLTALGSLLWNALLVGSGYALGARWKEIERYSEIFNYAIYFAVLAIVGGLVARRLRGSRRPADGAPRPRSGRDPARG